MNISPTQVTHALSEPVIGRFWLGYFQEGFRSAVHQELLEFFEHLKRTKGFTRTDLAKKIGRRPEQVMRWLSAPTNLESDTISDMALGMGLVPTIKFQSIEAVLREAAQHPVSAFVEGNGLDVAAETDAVTVEFEAMPGFQSLPRAAHSDLSHAA